ncbi:MAG: tetraacyldisaccharide 4'-kinase [Deltaproteobacteria bacterium]|nr:tetraacyldisaccharide 4'-kinase [Deltaproteobacteria bacterium]
MKKLYSLPGNSTFGVFNRLKNFSYKNQIFKPRIIDGIKVISVGNIAMGGRGKSPLARYIAEYLAKLEFRTAVVLRGYKSRLESAGAVVSIGKGPLLSAEMCGDEAFETAFLSKNIIVTIGADRSVAVKRAKKEGAEYAVLDDGFQHRKIKRDLDIVIITPEDVSDDENYFPAGRLREKKDSLERADIICGNFNKWKDVKESYFFPHIFFKYVPVKLINSEGEKIDFKKKSETPVHILSAIGDPGSFMESVKDAGFNIVSHTHYHDHHFYSQKELNKAVKAAEKNGAEFIITTVKDIGKIRMLRCNFKILALSIAVKIVEGEDILKEAIKKLQTI